MATARTDRLPPGAPVEGDGGHQQVEIATAHRPFGDGPTSQGVVGDLDHGGPNTVSKAQRRSARSPTEKLPSLRVSRDNPPVGPHGHNRNRRGGQDGLQLSLMFSPRLRRSRALKSDGKDGRQRRQHQLMFI